MTRIIAWLDVETGGINPDESPLLQVACILTDLTPELNVLASPYSNVVKFTAEEVEKIKSTTNDYVVNMHTQTGLWDKLPEGEALEAIDKQLYELISAHGDEKKVLLGGNSITLDRNFIERYLPKTFSYLSYQSIDVTTLALIAEAWYDGLHFEKTYTHDAVQDIEESLQQLRFFKETIFR